MALEQQLAEAAARVAAAEAALAEAKAKVADRLDAAVAAETEAARVHGQASDAVSAAEADCDRRLHLTIPQHNAPRQYHPDLLAAAARITGVAWEDRATVRPGNNSKDIYDAALFAYVQRQRAADPAVRAAVGVRKATGEASNAAWRAKQDIVHTYADQDGRVFGARHALREVQEKIQRRDEAKARTSDKAQQAIIARAREALAKIASGEIDPMATAVQGEAVSK